MSYRKSSVCALLTATALSGSAWSQQATPAATGTAPVSISVMDRSRTDAISFYADQPYTTTYPYVEQLLRISVAQKIKHFDWMAEVSEANVFDVPNTSVDPVTARGQLFLGATYYAANSNNTLPVAASFKQGFVRFHGKGADTTLRAGRFEFFDGQETQPKNQTLAWLQTNRVAQRLVGNFGFSNAQRSFDGIDGHYGKGTWDITAMAGRADQGVFNMNANPELNVDLQYLAFTKSELKQHFIWRLFAIDYHDGRTGVVKTDNRALAVRTADHKNIRVGSYGADFLTTIPAGPGSVDVVFWGVLQNGNWGTLNQHSGAVAVEAGYRLNNTATKPWLRGGFFRGTGDHNATDDQHNTFFQVLPTPRAYARFPFFNLMNSSDQFVQIVDNPAKKLEVRSDLHFLQLTSGTDLWYQGGGAYDSKVFGFTGRPGNGHNSFATLYDISSDYQLTPSLAVNMYYAHSFGKSVVASNYPAGHASNFGYLELVYRWGVKQRAPVTKN
ncbi:alginate export family protein [Granulicella arctica]|uniref:alginate export family protein n=1 Tax=Granulicella arctica TaxID=940613 RepID=UPI0021DFCD25|nr:alginate export family protein [Granulicella arctica]